MAFAEIIGQKRVCRALKQIIDSEKYASLLFVGPPGVGKRTVALRFAQEINCEVTPGMACGTCATCRRIARLAHPDVSLLFPIRKPRDATPEGVIEAMTKQYDSYNLASPQPPVPPNFSISIEAIRWLRSEMAKPPLQAKLRLFIILNAHQLTPEAQNALLKILEEPEEHTIFILTTSAPGMLFPTIHSRSQLLRFAHIPEVEIVRWLQTRNIISHYPYELVAALSDGSLGRALAIATAPEDYFSPLLLKFLTSPRVTETEVLRTVENLLREKTPIDTIISTALFYCRNALRAQLGLPHFPQLPVPCSQSLNVPALLEKLQFLLTRAKDLHLNTNPTLTLHSLLEHLTG